jgi:hypothetical protein
MISNLEHYLSQLEYLQKLLNEEAHRAPSCPTAIPTPEEALARHAEQSPKTVQNSTSRRIKKRELKTKLHTY